MSAVAPAFRRVRCADQAPGSAEDGPHSGPYKLPRPDITFLRASSASNNRRSPIVAPLQSWILEGITHPAEEARSRGRGARRGGGGRARTCAGGGSGRTRRGGG